MQPQHCAKHEFTGLPAKYIHTGTTQQCINAVMQQPLWGFAIHLQARQRTRMVVSQSSLRLCSKHMTWPLEVTASSTCLSRAMTSSAGRG